MSSRLVFVTGAGISVAAGLRTYRGSGGLWTAHPELEFASFDEQVDRILALRDQAAIVEPTAAHLAIASTGSPVITQNIDGLHQRAGSELVVEAHGNVHRTRSDGRIDVVMFHETLGQQVGSDIRRTLAAADTVVVAGTGLEVWPFAGWVLDAGWTARMLWFNIVSPPQAPGVEWAWYDGDVQATLPAWIAAQRP